MIVLDLNKSAGLLDLSKVAPTLKKARGILNWDENPLHKDSLTEGFDLDLFAFVLGEKEKVSGAGDVVFFNNKSYANGAVAVPVDNRTGAGKDDEEITLNFDLIPADKSYVDVYVFIHDAAARKQTFGMMANASFNMVDQDTGVQIVKYNISTYTNETVIHIGRFERTANGWGFSASGDASRSDPNAVVQAYL